MHFIDVHCHLACPAFDADRAEVIARARDAGLECAVVVGEHFEDNLRVLDAAAGDPFIRPALGHHPWHMDKARADLPRTLALIDENAAMLVAIGEVGLDYRTAEGPEARGYQQEVFKAFIDAAQRHALPLSVHVRSAGHYVIDMLIDAGAPLAALHAFDGKVGHALRGAQAGFYFSIPPTVMFSRQKQKLARALPLDKLLLESDAPALGPAPGQRSVPALLPSLAQKIAALKNVAEEDVIAAAYENARSVFGLR